MSIYIYQKFHLGRQKGDRPLTGSLDPSGPLGTGPVRGSVADSAVLTRLMKIWLRQRLC